MDILPSFCTLQTQTTCLSILYDPFHFKLSPSFSFLVSSFSFLPLTIVLQPIAVVVPKKEDVAAFKDFTPQKKGQKQQPQEEQPKQVKYITIFIPHKYRLKNKPFLEQDTTVREHYITNH